MTAFQLWHGNHTSTPLLACRHSFDLQFFCDLHVLSQAALCQNRCMFERLQQLCSSSCNFVESTYSGIVNFFDRLPTSLGFVAHQIHLCFQARTSDELQLPPHRRLYSIEDQMKLGQHWWSSSCRENRISGLPQITPASHVMIDVHPKFSLVCVYRKRLVQV